MRYSGNTLESVRVKTRRKVPAGRFVLLALLLAALAACYFAGKALDTGSARAAYAEVGTEPAAPLYLAPTELDRDAEPDASAEPIDLSACADTLEITSGGSYLLTGRLKGRVLIRAEEQIVHLYLDGVDISSLSGPAILCESAGKLIITVTDGTENSVSDAADYRNETWAEGCISAQCAVTVNGGGSLSVCGFYKDAIRSSDAVKLMDGELAVKCRRIGIHGADGAAVYGGTVTIHSEKYAVKTTKSGGDGRGDIVIAGGELDVVSGRTSFVAERADLIVSGCTIRDKSVTGTYSVGGAVSIDEGCIV